MRQWVKLVVIGLVLLVSACGNQQEASNEIRVGTISGPETQLMQVAQNVALEKYGLKVKIIEFSDYNLPNQALADGSIDINMFQHMPYLMAAIKANHFDLVPIAKTFIYPMAIYSSKLTQISAVKKNAIVAIPNDPTNEARSLLLMQKAGLITLKPNMGITATPADILSNPLHLTIKELDAAQLPRVLPDVDIAVINSNYAIAAGLQPKVGSKDVIFVEGNDSLYANLFVVKSENKNSPKIRELVAAFQSPQVLDAANMIFNGDAIKAW